ATPLDVSGRRDQGTDVMITVRVEDTGIGIPEEAQLHIFDKFTQAESSTTRQYGGTGLGLAICQALVSIMGGRLQLESQVGVGSTFFFTVQLPLAKDPETTRAEQVDLSQARVLVVDDVAVNRTILQEHLQAWNVTVAEAASGEAALRLLHAAVADHQPFDIVITDYMMPQMDGLHLATMIHGDAQLQDTLIVMASSAVHLNRNELEQAGIAALLVKPIRARSLHDTLCT
ncbi:hybrid sensor histidine kinase/response regulator, partial [Candidatus Entotheonella serta]